MEQKEKKQPVSLKSLMSPSKTVTIDFPGYEGFTVDLCHLSRDELIKLRKRCLVNKFNKKSHVAEEVLDDDKFLTEYCKSIIKGWKGLKFRYLEELLLVETDDLDPDSELEYSKENAEVLMKNASVFDTWVTETVGDLENFTRAK
jgi:hypothetical protein|tara:strand:+ start:10094 stop:10528 length:435 start_codon:yes stop_codon:yes gene_type:complete